ncbi:hypothetical protein DE4576_04958 [Mycobacterium marinum]|uniref:hypothetical protein n=1 Tax=Mycobacterium marinum TaxID=1781 RepID=UPI000E3D7E1B|nr:hypothetical protein [Mycobacterium marinum]RFZ63019.1 hypothetical protein DE4576_04958 [Mycobacterium marinum]
MTCPTQGAAGREQIPGLGEAQPPTEVIDAHWTAVDQVACGWNPKALEFDPHAATALVAATTPTGHTVTVSWDLRDNDAARQQWTGQASPNRRLDELVRAVASLGQEDAETGDERLTQLCWQVQWHLGSAHRHQRNWRSNDQLPTVPAADQPMTQEGAAGWLIARLVANYRWRISHLGEEIAGGGFIAAIPGDVPAIFPATMQYDGTAAAGLARMLPTVQTQDLHLLASLDYRALWAARDGAGGQP